jgi:putative ABC transport system permease protein
MLSSWIADAHYAARRLRGRPGYALLAVLTLALGVGGTAAAYGVARGVLFDPLPYANERAVGVFWKKTDWTEEEFLFVRGRVPGFDQVALYRHRDVILRDGDAPAHLLPGISASAELFDVLGAHPMLGRGFNPGEDAQGAEPVAVLSYSLWQEMGGDRSIVGKRLTLDGSPRTMVGVMSPGFWFPDPAVRIWTPEPLSVESRSWNSTLIGRVATGHDVRAMAAPVARLTAMLDERFDYPAQWDKTKNPLITPLRDDLLGSMRPALRATLGAMALILLIACANVAALMLGQLDARSAELAVRSALGANHRRLTQQLVIEATLIAVTAGVLGAGLALGGFSMLAHALPLGAWAEATAPDWSVFAAAMGVAVAAAMLVVLVPTVSLWRGDLRGALSSARTGGLEGRGGRMENGLVVAEVALAVLIAAGAGLLLRSVANLYAVDPGLRTEGVAVVDVTTGRLTRQRRLQTIDELTAALGALPGVRSAAAVQTLPLRGGGYNLPMSIQGHPDLTGLTTEYRVVTPGYLESMGIALRDGRTITAADGGDAERVVVINEALADKYFAGVNPIGTRVGGDVDSSARIVGVVANAAEGNLTDTPKPVRYVAVAQMQWVDEAQTLVLNTAPGVDETSLLVPARRTIERVAPGVAVQGTTTMRRVLDTAVGPARQVMSLLTLLTALALTLGAVGIYGVIAHFAARRRRDWAIKVALGLPGSRVVAQVIGHGALLVTTGIGIGVLAATALARLLSSLLYGVHAIDPIAFAAAGAALLGVGLLAAFIPAWRAGMVDPAIALREQ